MEYRTSKQISELWGVSERSVRLYCAEGRIPGAYMEGKTWMIPEDAKKPARQKRHTNRRRTLSEALKEEKMAALKGGIYHKLQVDMTYNSNHMEGSKLTQEETRYIYETRTIGEGRFRVDDILETINHFRCIDLGIDFANRKLSEPFIKSLHRILKQGTEDSQRPWFMVGDYKLVENLAGERETTHPSQVKKAMKELLDSYQRKENHSFEEIVAFHVAFERIHPFQDGNGRVGRLIAFKECLKNGIVPFIILDEKKDFYYRGLKKWDEEKTFLLKTCRDGQDTIKRYLDYFGISY
ncbi:MAG: Fic family protein [Bacilli bacterium]|nr:Fic family protein [Bacilli bacterium]